MHTYSGAVAGTGHREIIRGTRIGSGAVEPPRQVPHPAEDVADPVRPRHVVDYALARRRTLQAVRNDALLLPDVCDAHPDLLRAARYHGEQTERTCPLCQRSQLVHVTYTFGDDLGYLTGRLRSSAELPQLALEFGHFRVYVVEVCQRCSWNHLHLSYVLGDGVPRVPPRTPSDVLE
jgi:hypothetical protein